MNNVIEVPSGRGISDFRFEKQEKMEYLNVECCPDLSGLDEREDGILRKQE